MSEQDALKKLGGLESSLAAAQCEVARVKGLLQERQDELATQRAVNQQLMLKKEEVEWQLMAAIAKVRVKHVRGKGAVLVPCMAVGDDA